MTASGSMRERIRQRVKAHTNGHPPSPEGSHVLAVALDYARRGWPVLPIHTPTRSGCSCSRTDCGSIGKHPRTEHGVKDASTEEAQIRAWWQRWPDANVGVATGAMSGLVVLDVDPRHGGGDTLADLENQQDSLPPTVEALTGGGGFHKLYKYPGYPVKSGAGVLGPGLDIKGDGGYIVAAPSLHASGRRYGWEASSHPDEVPIAEAPTWLLALLSAAQNGNGNGHGFTVGEKIKEGERNSTLFRLARSLKAKGLPEAVILATLRATNAEQCDPPLDEAEVKQIARHACEQADRPEFEQNGNVDVEHLTDLGNARRLIERHGGDLRYIRQWGRWLDWDGTRWQQDETGEAERRAKETVKSIYAQAAAQTDEALRKALAKHALRCESDGKIKAMLSLAATEPEIAITPEQLDRDLWRLNCLNGTVDLRTGSLRPHARGDLITKLAPVTYDLKATCPTFEAFLQRIMDNNDQLIAYLQHLIGYCLTGDVSEQGFDLFYGTGANGKSTLINTVLGLLDDYGKQAAPRLLMRKYGESHPTEVADLFGARFIACVEVEDGKRLDEVLVKQLTGGDSVKARLMRQDFFAFPPTWKIVMAVNHKPVIHGVDHAIWRRVRLVPFTVTIPKGEQDKRLGEKLRAELPGILAWAVRGCLAWQAHGLQVPREVQAATREYRQEMDTLGDFLAVQCVVEAGATELKGEVYGAYRDWCKETGEVVESHKWLTSKLRDRGIQDRKRGGMGSWIGLRLRRRHEHDPRRGAQGEP